MWKANKAFQGRKERPMCQMLQEGGRQRTNCWVCQQVTDDFDENSLCRAVDESLIEVDSKDRKIESETGKYKHFF